MKNILVVGLLNFLAFHPAVIPFAMCQDSLPASAAVKTLKDIFTEALKNSERIAVSLESIRQAEALYRETLGGSFPEFTYRRDSSFEDPDDSSHEGAFRITKTDLTGYRELAALRSGRSTVNQRKHEQERVEQLLFQDTAQAFYSLLLAEENVAATTKLISLGQERLSELQKRVDVGRAREADAVGQEVLITSLESQLEENLRQVKARRDLLAFLMGIPELKDGVREGVLSIQTYSLEDYLALAQNRPDIQAAQQNIHAAKGLKEVARSEYLPKLGLTANSYSDRPKSQESTEWDVALSVSLPLWDWGSRRGALDAADSGVHQSELNFQLALRQAKLEIRNAFRDYESARKQLGIQAKAVELARKDYEMQVQDDRRGLVTNLEVFESLDRLNNAELAYNNARLQEKLAAITLKIASGTKPKDILE